MRRLLVALMVVGLLGACASDEPESDAVQVVASFYALAEVANRVGDGLVDVTNLTPAGVEPHDVELTPGDRDTIEDADVVLFVGGDFQEAIADAADEREAGAVDIGRGVGLEGDDPHFWLDLSLMEKAVIVVRDALTDVDSAHRQSFKENADSYIAELRALDQRFKTTLAECARRELVTAHEAFGYLAKRYNLTQYAISGVSPESEASPERLAELVRLVRDKGVTTVFYEELVPRDFADTLAKEAGIKTAVLSPLEGLTAAEVKRGEDYLSVMGRNRAALAQALGCATA